jgi:hypothetical protein
MNACEEIMKSLPAPKVWKYVVIYCDVGMLRGLSTILPKRSFNDGNFKILPRLAEPVNCS